MPLNNLNIRVLHRVVEQAVTELQKVVLSGESASELVLRITLHHPRTALPLPTRPRLLPILTPDILHLPLRLFLSAEQVLGGWRGPRGGLLLLCLVVGWLLMAGWLHFIRGRCL